MKKAAKGQNPIMAAETLAPYLECGRIINTHGCRGGIKVEPWADSPADLCRLTCFYLRKENEMVPLTVHRASVMKGKFLLLELDSVTCMEDAAVLRGHVLYALRADVPLRAGQYFLADTEGLTVLDGRPGREGHVLGCVAEIIYGAATPMFAVDTGRKQVLVPAVAAFVKEVIPGDHVTMTPIDGMFDGEAVIDDSYSCSDSVCEDVSAFPPCSERGE